MAGGGPGAEGKAEAEGEGEGNGAKEEGARERLANNFEDGATTKFEGVAEVTPKDVTAVAEDLLRERAGEAVFFFEESLAAGIERAFGGKGGAGGETDKEKAESENGEKNGEAGKDAAEEKGEHNFRKGEGD